MQDRLILTCWLVVWEIDSKRLSYVLQRSDMAARHICFVFSSNWCDVMCDVNWNIDINHGFVCSSITTSTFCHETFHRIIKNKLLNTGAAVFTYSTKFQNNHLLLLFQCFCYFPLIILVVYSMMQWYVLKGKHYIAWVLKYILAFFSACK